MRRTSRILLTTTSTATSLLSLIALALWAQSFRHEVTTPFTHRGQQYLLTITGGRTTIDNPPQLAADAKANAQARAAQILLARTHYIDARNRADQTFAAYVKAAA